MKIGVLLAAGRSLAGQKDRIGRYRPVDPRSMPKFDTGGGPVRSVSTSTPGGSASSSSAEEVAVVAQCEPVTAPVPAPAPSSGRSAASFPEPKCRADLPRKRTAWGRLLGALWPHKSESPKISAGKRPVQVELRLEQVKVVRNDLSDADLEVIPVKAPAPKTPEPARQSALPGAENSGRRGTLSILRILS